MKSNTKKYRILDLFAGAGGFSYGFSLVTDDKNRHVFEVIKAVEIDPYACKTLKEHLETKENKKGKIVYEGDLTNPQVKNKLIIECKGNIDIIIGGPPCQTFSLAGPSRSGSKKMRQMLKNDKRNILFKHYLDLVREIKPKFVVFENVEGITSKNSSDILDLNNKNKKVIELICEELKAMGYMLGSDLNPDQEYMILNAADYGVPQERKRVFIVANRIDMGSVLNPYPESNYGKGRGMPYVTLRDAIGDLPPLLPVLTTRSFKSLKKIRFVLEYYQQYLIKICNEVIKYKGQLNNDKFINELEILIKDEVRNTEGKNANFTNVLEFIKKANKTLKTLSFTDEYNNKNIYYNNNIKNFKKYIKGKAKKLTLHNARPHNLRDIIIFILMKSGTTSSHFFSENKDIYSNKDLKRQLQKLYPYDFSKHVDTYVKHDFDKPSKTILAHLAKDGLRFIHPEQPRTFTPREAARLQSFPDDFYFHGPMISQYRQIGNAVPPLLAKAIGEAIYSKLKNIKTKRK